MIYIKQKMSYMEKKLNNSHFYTCKALMLVTLKLTIVAILRMILRMELGATQWTKMNVGSFVLFLHVKLEVGVFSRVKLSVCLFSSTVGCVWNFQIGEAINRPFFKIVS